MDEITGRGKRSRNEDGDSERLGGTVQTSLRDHFLRRADSDERRGKRSDNDIFGLLSPEQVTTLLPTVGAEYDEMADDDEEEEEAEVGVEPDEIQDEDSVMAQDEQLEHEERQEDVEMDDIRDDSEPDQPQFRPKTPPSAPKSDRNLFKSRQKNFVHNLTTTNPLTLSAIRTQHSFLQDQHAHHHSSHNGTIASKKYAVPAEKAEERLSLTVSKEDFARMRIVGQFNLGFIIAVRERRGEGEGEDVEDVFIIDQHASDEKHNFERLQAEIVMQVQTLAR